MSDLSAKHCIPCRGGIPPMTPEQIDELRPQLTDGWEVVDYHHLSKTFTFPDFAQALALVNRIGAIAEEEGHHPNISFTWGTAKVDIWTHKIDGLVLSDFVLAAKIDDLGS